MNLSIKTPAALALAATLVVPALFVPREAAAASWRTCNGSAVQWRGTLNLHRNRCSIADSGNVNSAYWNGARQWDNLSGVVDGFFVNSAADCSISHGDGQNEVGLVNRANIDGANGMTILQLGLCFIGSNDIDEADVMIANDLSFTPQWGNFRGTTGRSTFVHEFGHLFGFLHQDSHDVMRTSPPHILTGGSEPSTVWPADSSGMSSLYGFASNRANLLPSALGVVGGVVQTLDAAGTVAMCRGASGTSRIYLGNLGNVGSGTYNLRIRLSTTSPTAGYSGSTNVAATFTHSLGAFSQGTYDLGFRVPAALPNGTYYIYHDMDYTGSLLELREGDNSTVSAKKILVNC
ncbi:MAG TPA: hypothetical protein VLA16_24865 [Ideonella sp.]|nr:hypothetical protein [Ideonella sp.]